MSGKPIKTKKKDLVVGVRKRFCPPPLEIGWFFLWGGGGSLADTNIHTESKREREKENHLPWGKNDIWGEIGANRFSCDNG